MDPLPPKPMDESGFKRPVAWLFGREMLATFKSVILYSLFAGKLDPKDWMRPGIIDLRGREENGEFWFDYLADTGDGQMAAYSIAYLCMSDLWVEQAPRAASEVSFNENPERSVRLPRGAFLFVGGDTSYHVADYPTLSFRFQAPFHWAFEDLKREGRITDKRRPLFAIPGNHDYYDSIDGFNRQFRKAATGEDEKDGRPALLSISGFERQQEASYVALRLPFGWWLYGMDAQGGDMDFRQSEFFRCVHRENTPAKLIVATPEPTTVLGKYASPDSKIAITFEAIGLERPFLREGGKIAGGKCRLDLSGDTHHYARYWGPRVDWSNETAPVYDNYASVVAGLGGAFVQPSHVDVGEVEEHLVYPSKKDSREAFARELFNPWNILSGGYVWLLGFVIAAALAFAATVPESSKQAVHNVLSSRSLRLPQQPLEVVRPSPRFGGSAELPSQAPTPIGPLPWILLVVSLAAIVAGVVYSKRLLDHFNKGSASRKTSMRAVSLRDRLVVGGAGLVGAASLAGWMWSFAANRSDLTQFGSSLLVMAALIFAVVAFAGSILYSDYLFKQAYARTLRWFDSWPGWVLYGMSALSGGSALWLFGKHPAAYLISDLLFAVVLLAVGPGLVVLAVIVGGSLQGAAGKIGFAALGLWHGFLQLTTPFVLVFFGSWWMVLIAVILIFLFRKLGQLLAARNARLLLVLAWLVYGVLLIGLPLYGDRLGLQFSLSGALLPFADLKWRLASCVLAGLVGAVMTCVTLGWYFAVSLAFNGHMDQAGGAGRVEKFKQFIRVRVTEQSLTAYVIGIDDPKMEGHDLKPKVIDWFHLSA